MEFLNTLDLGMIAIYVAAAVGVASVVAAITPTKLDDVGLSWVRKLLKFAALNVLNADDSKKFEARLNEMQEYATKLEAAVDEKTKEKAAE